MSATVLAFFNNKGNVGATSLVYHLSWMLAEIGTRVLACDLDSQANLTAAFLDERELAELLRTGTSGLPNTVSRSIASLTGANNLKMPELKLITPNLALFPGDLGLCCLEDELSAQWAQSLGSATLSPAFRGLTAFWQLAQSAATQHSAELVLFDLGPNLGAINRSALIGSDFLVVPLRSDLFSLEALHLLGPALRHWHRDWQKLRENWRTPNFDLPAGNMKPMGYILQQHEADLSRAYSHGDNWADRISREYARSILEAEPTGTDTNRLATLKSYRSLVRLGQEAHKPIFDLTVADGAMGSHLYAVKQAHSDYHSLAQKIRAFVTVYRGLSSKLLRDDEAM